MSARAAFGKVYADLAEMEDLLRDGDLDWTAVRPPKLTSKPFTGRYRTAAGQNVRGGWSVPRADVAHLMLAVLGRPETIGQVMDFSDLGSPWESTKPRQAGLRFRLVKGFEKYVLFYRRDEQQVYLLRVLHSSQDIEELLG